jgi:hypothetical protein
MKSTTTIDGRRYCMMPHMRKGDVKAILSRVLTWPAGAQQEAVATLRAIEIEWLGDDAYRAAPEELDAIDDADRSGVATDDEVEAVLRSFRAV